MLSDDELQAIATEYLRSELPDWNEWGLQATYLFNFEEPSGVYFATEGGDDFLDVTTYEMYAHLEFGFFVSRTSGTTRTITRKEMFSALDNLRAKYHNPDIYWESELKPQIIQYILTGSAPKLPRGPWWRIW